MAQKQLDPIVWIDLETGGTDPAIHQITQIAAIVTTGGPELEEIGEPFERKICLIPGHFTQEALKVQGFSKKVWDAESCPIEVALNQLVDYVRPHAHTCVNAKGKKYKAAYVGGYNVSFDVDFLRAASGRNKVWLPLMTWTGGYFDVLQLLRWHTIGAAEEPSRFQLRSACDWLGLPPFSAHDAAEDIRNTVKLARVLLCGI